MGKHLQLKINQSCPTSQMALIKPITFVGFVLKMLFFLGIKPSENPSFIYKFYGLMIFIIFFATYDVLLIGEVFNSTNFNEMVYSGACAIGMMVVGGRHLTLFFFSGNVHFLIKEIIEHSTDDDKLLHNINNNLKNFSTFANIFFATVVFTVTGLFFLPVISSSKLLPYKVWFPVDINSNIFSLISSKAYAIVCMGLFAISILSTLLIWYLMFNVAIRYKTFGSRLKTLNKIEHSERNGSNCEQLIEVIKLHLQIHEIVQVVRETFHNLFLFQLTTSGVGICCVLYVLVFASKDNFTEFIIYGVLLGYLVFEIMAIMYFGNEITLTSGDLCYCLYESNWCDESEVYKKMMLAFMAMLKKPETIVIAKVFPLSLNMFMSIMRISYSSFNILRTFAE